MAYEPVYSPWHMKLNPTNKTITIDLYPDIVEHPGVEENFNHLFEMMKEYCIPRVEALFKKGA